ncbi:hypothetical protein PRZ48_005015 [Zasmidium cellare]|uniref:Actin-like ATPase domain-containing protein n=1 Tax=Zasmidium cellare TaxID=395010 RepID=A0ABR0ES72_ZASCE|nr:hypothetical protein PRZ48_005015 [Zasmidium cellare]
MAVPTTNGDYFSGRTSTRTRPTASALKDIQSPGRSPRTPTVPSLGRSISSQFGSPGSFRTEQEDVIIYELGPRYFSAGHAGESRPRCILPFTPELNRRPGDYRHYDPLYATRERDWRLQEEWGTSYELYRTDLRELDLGLVEDRLERMLRRAQTEFLQLDAKPRKAVLIIPSLLPTPLLEIALKVLFGHFTQPPSIVVLTTPVLCCVSAGLRDALVVDIGWEETMVTAIGEYKEVARGSTIRAGKLLTREIGTMIEEHIRSTGSESLSDFKATFKEAEDVAQRMAWCRQREAHANSNDEAIRLPIFGSDPPRSTSLPFTNLAEPVETALFATGSAFKDYDDHDLSLPLLVYRTLLSLPVDLRAICVSRIVITGTVSKTPGLKRRLLQEINQLVESRGWDQVSNYGSAQARRDKPLKERSANSNLRPGTANESASSIPLSPLKMPLQEAIPHADRVHDDIKDPVTLKAEREAAKGKAVPVKGIVRGVETLGPWAGASLVASMRVKGAHEIEREDFLKHGLKTGMHDI